MVKPSPIGLHLLRGIMCRPKKEGGLGIKDCSKWNVAAIGKLVRDLASKVDTLWVRWVNHVYLKGTSWWEFSPPNDACWVFRKICKVCEIVAPANLGDCWSKQKDGRHTVSSGFE